MERLKGITGFISILGNDPRIEVFKRYHHVMRAAQLTEYLCERFTGYDIDEALLVTYLHDINRLPFAHNFEKRIGFDQAANLELFCEHFSLDVPIKTIFATKAVLNKEVDGPPSSKIVYSADAALGFIEDPLLAIITLDVPPHFIPAEILAYLNFQKESLLPELSQLKYAYSNNIDAFMTQLNELIVRRAIDFIEKHSQVNKLFIELPNFPLYRKLLKEDFLRSRVFPINNEQVCHGSRLAEEIGIPYLNLLASRCDDPILHLLSMTDKDLLEAAIEENIINDPTPYYPSLP